jgi:hypothetical protein
VADPFIARQDLTDYLGKNVNSDAGALAAVDAACDICRDIAEQTFNQVLGDTVTLDGPGTDALLLPELPVSAAGTVSLRDSEGNWTTAGTADYALNGNGILLATNTSGTADFGTTWPSGRQNIRVTYEHGYADADLPRSVRMVALSIASRLIVQGVAQFETEGDVSIRYAVNSTDLTNGEKAILRKYRQAK